MHSSATTLPLGTRPFVQNSTTLNSNDRPLQVSPRKIPKYLPFVKAVEKERTEPPKPQFASIRTNTPSKLRHLENSVSTAPTVETNPPPLFPPEVQEPSPDVEESLLWITKSNTTLLSDVCFDPVPLHQKLSIEQLKRKVSMKGDSTWILDQNDPTVLGAPQVFAPLELPHSEAEQRVLASQFSAYGSKDDPQWIRDTSPDLGGKRWETMDISALSEISGSSFSGSDQSLVTISEIF